MAVKSIKGFQTCRQHLHIESPRRRRSVSLICSPWDYWEDRAQRSSFTVHSFTDSGQKSAGNLNDSDYCDIDVDSEMIQLNFWSWFLFFSLSEATVPCKCSCTFIQKPFYRFLTNGLWSLSTGSSGCCSCWAVNPVFNAIHLPKNSAVFTVLTERKRRTRCCHNHVATTMFHHGGDVQTDLLC